MEDVEQGTIAPLPGSAGGSPPPDAKDTPTPTDRQSVEGSVSGKSADGEPMDSAPNWDDARNPYRSAAQELQRLTQEQENTRLQQSLYTTAANMQKGGYTPEQIEERLTTLVERHQLEQQRVQLEERARPVAAAALAEHLKSVYGVDISPMELLKNSQGGDVTSREAMLSRADALVTERRKTAFAQRQKQGSDKVESGGGAGGFDVNSLKGKTPQQIIRLAIGRMNK